MIKYMVRSAASAPLTSGLILASVIAFFASVPEFWTTGRVSTETLDHLGLAPVSHPVHTEYRFDTLVTSVFLHANTIHLLLNVCFLWIFGSKVEKASGKKRFAVLFVISALFSSMVALLAYDYPTLGAQGAISGLAAAYVLTETSSRRIAILLQWLVYNYLLAWMETPGFGYLTHLAGLAVGFIVILDLLTKSQSLKPR